LNTASASGVFADKTVGAGKTVSVSGLTMGGADAANYTLTQPTTTANITAKGLTVAAVNQTKIYGATNPVLTASYSGFVAGENASVLSGIPALSTTANTNSPAAGSPYPITSARGSLSAANYSFTFADGTLTVSKAELIAQAEDQSRLYGTTNPVFTISYSGFANGETAAVIDVPPTASTLADTNSPSGTYAITLSGGSDDNYALTLVDGIMTVTQAPVVGLGQRITAIEPTNGVIVLTLEGISGETYHIQATPTLSPPIPWAVIGTNTAGTDGLSQFIDTDTSLYPVRFYRSVKP
jgi:hypothetical protein